MTAYTTPDAIAAYLAVTLTPAQEAQATVAADAITVWIDHRTGRSWQPSAAIASEVHTVDGTYIWLDATPVASLQSVTKFDGVGNGFVLLDPSQYELVNPLTGQVGFLGGYGGSIVDVAYTSVAAVLPDDLAYAATVLAADLLGPTLDPDLVGVDSVAVGQNDINLKFASAGSTLDSGATSAVRVVDSYRRVVLA